jgi:hypothetical protein
MIRPLLVAAAILLAAAPAARAHGDPAGDVLTVQTVFYGGALDLRSKPAAQLPALLEAAQAEGLELRVAAFSVPRDLGENDYLWDDPLNYVQFLSEGLSSVYSGWTLVVMPSGYAIHRPGEPSAREQRVLDRVAPVGEDPSAVLPGAMAAVQRLAAAHGLELEIPDVEPPPGGMTQPVSHFESQQAAPPAADPSGDGEGWLVALPLLAVLAVGGAFVVRRAISRRTA